MLERACRMEYCVLRGSKRGILVDQSDILAMMASFLIYHVFACVYRITDFGETIIFPSPAQCAQTKSC